MIIDFNNDTESIKTDIEKYIANLEIESNSKYISLKEPLLIKTPDLYIPFGVEKFYSNYILKLQLRNFKMDKIILFAKIIIELENKLNSLLDDCLVSNMKYSDKYDPLLTVKLLQTKNQFTCNAFKGDEPLNILDINTKQICKCDLIIDNIWKFKDKYYYKIKLKNLFI